MRFRFIPVVTVIVIIMLCTNFCFGLAESMGPGGCNVEKLHDMGLTGKDVDVGLISLGHPQYTHQAFGDPGRVSWYDVTGKGYQPVHHDTWVAGVVASEGDTTHPDHIGVAPESCIHSAAVTVEDLYDNTKDALRKLIINQNCRVMYSGIQLWDVPNGESFPTLIYDYYADKHNCFFANPAGNKSNVTVFGDAYNGVTVGGLILEDPDNTEIPFIKVGSDSGSGFTDDGRRKPEITAPAQNQTVPSAGSDTNWSTWVTDENAEGATSFSTPYVAGVAALLIEYADNCGNPDANNTEVIKAAIINSAFGNIKNKSGEYTYPDSNTWQADRGYGRVDGFKAFQTLQAGAIAADANITQTKGWAFKEELSPAQQDTYKIFAEKNTRLKITLTWNRRIEWNDQQKNPNKFGFDEIDPDELTGYLADLDLVVTDPCGQEIFSRQLNGLNPKDNLEKCDELVEEKGFYTVDIVNNSDNSESADYGLAFEVYPRLEGDCQPIDYRVDYKDLKFLTNSWADLYNFTDLAAIQKNWLNTDKAYYRSKSP